MNPIIQEITAAQVKKDTPPFKVGDGVRVHTKVREGDKERTQIFSGIVIALKGHGIHEMFTVRRISYGEGVERVFPVNSPNLEKIEIERESEPMKARLYYLRNRTGKAAVAIREKEKRTEAVAAPAARLELSSNSTSRLVPGERVGIRRFARAGHRDSGASQTARWAVSVFASSRRVGGRKSATTFPMTLETSLLAKAADQARGLAIDAVHASSSGHLGLPLGCAEIGAVLFGHALVHNPDRPRWINRDRFILSAGHGSMFLYSWLHLSGYDLPIEQVKKFRAPE